MLIKYATVRDVRDPERGHPTDAGIDFFMPIFDDQFVEHIMNLEANQDEGPSGKLRFEAGRQLLIPPHANALIPSGVKVEIPYGFMGLFLNKSGIASKSDLLIGGQVIDTFYSGEVHIDLHNVRPSPIMLTEGQKIAQMILVPYLACDPTLVGEDQLYDWMKQDEYRDEGGHGSTG
jgi:dUTP pyrophosphatase